MNALAELAMHLVSRAVVGTSEKEQMKLWRIYTGYEGNTPSDIFN